MPDAPAALRRAPRLLDLPLGPALGIASLAFVAAAILAVASGGTDGADGGAVALTGWSLSIAKLAMDVAGLGVLGSVLFAAVLTSAPRGELGEPALAALRAGSWWALGLAEAAAVASVLALAEISGTSVVGALSGAALLGFVTDVAQGRALVVVVVVAVLLALTGARVRTAAGARLLLVGAVVALIPPTLTGHAANPASHDLAVLTIVAHVVSVSCWIGGLAAVVLFARGATLASAASRFSSLALGCFVVAGLTGAANAWIRVGGVPGLGDLWGSQYGWLLTGKIVAFVALGWFGWWHRRRTLPGIAAGRRAAFRRFATVEAVVMVLAVVLAVALARSPTPAPAGRSELGLPCSSDPAVLLETVPHAVVARWEHLCSL